MRQQSIHNRCCTRSKSSGEGRAGVGGTPPCQRSGCSWCNKPIRQTSPWTSAIVYGCVVVVVAVVAAACDGWSGDWTAWPDRGVGRELVQKDGVHLSDWPVLKWPITQD